jgi:hypothetical protein
MAGLGRERNGRFGNREMKSCRGFSESFRSVRRASVETEGEMSRLRELGVHAAPGWSLGRLVPIEELWRVVI